MQANTTTTTTTNRRENRETKKRQQPKEKKNNIEKRKEEMNTTTTNYSKRRRKLRNHEIGMKTDEEASTSSQPAPAQERSCFGKMRKWRPFQNNQNHLLNIA